MPITLSQLKEQRKTVEVEFRGEKFEVTYKPNAMTPVFSDKLSQALRDTSEELTQADTWMVALAMVDSWEIYDDDGNQLDVSIEVVNQLPNALLRAVREAVTEDMAPNPPTDKPSKGGSF